MDFAGVTVLTGVLSNDILGAEKEAKLEATLRDGLPGDPATPPVDEGGEDEKGEESEVVDGRAGTGGAVR